MKAINALLVVSLLCVIAAPAFAQTLGSDIDSEVQAYDAVTIAQEQNTIQNTVQSTVTETAQIASRLGIDSQTTQKYSSAEAAVGGRQLTLNAQLRLRLATAEQQGDEIIQYMQAKGLDTAELEQLRTQIRELKQQIGEELSVTQFAQKVSQAQTSANQFKEKVQASLTEQERTELRTQLRSMADSSEVSQAKASESKYRAMYNEKSANSFLARINAEVAEMHQNGDKLMNLSEKFMAMHQLKNQLLGQNASKENVEQFRLQWQATVQNYKTEKNQTIATNERAKLYQEAYKIRQVIDEANTAGTNTTEVENQFQNTVSEIKQVTSGSLEQIRQKAVQMNSTLGQIANHEQIRTRFQTAFGQQDASGSQAGTSGQGNQSGQGSGSTGGNAG